MYEIGEQVDFPISRTEANFDRACDMAFRLALMTFDVDCGNFNKVVGSERSKHALKIKFVSYVRHGSEHDYLFRGSVE